MVQEPPTSTGATWAGRLSDPDLDLRRDPRADPRIVAALRRSGLDVRPPAMPVTVDAPREHLLGVTVAFEKNFQDTFEDLYRDLAPVPGVVSETTTITGPDGNEIVLYVHRPTTSGPEPLPGLVHFHGGGMTILRATDGYFVRWRDELAATGLVVVGVEFRNAGGQHGNHPFPAGLGDCAAATRWVVANAGHLGIDKVIVSGESGGGNLTLAVPLLAKREGWIGDIAGAYALCPFISNRWLDDVRELPSLRENDGYLLGRDVLAVMGAVYDPGNVHAADPTCWPLAAAVADLQGLPPHVVSVNQLDPLRDEGLAYARLLWGSGVSTVSRTLNGTCHGADVLMIPVVPEVCLDTVRAIRAFAGSL